VFSQTKGKPKYEYARFPEKMCNGKLLYVSLSFEATDIRQKKNGFGGWGYMDWNGPAEDPDLPAMNCFAVSTIPTSLSHYNPQ
jgi:hypothetical protein